MSNSSFVSITKASSKLTTGVRKHSGRRQSGQALVEGGVALVLIVGGTVASTLLLANVGLSTYYKEKLGFVCNQASSYASQLPRKENPSDKTKKFVNELVAVMGLPVSGIPSILVDNSITVNGQSAVKVTINAEMKLIGQGDITPLTVPVTDSSVAMLSASAGSAPGSLASRAMAVNGVVEITNAVSDGTRLFVPAYGVAERGGALPPGIAGKDCVKINALPFMKGGLINQ